MKLRIRGGRLIDPANQIDKISDLRICDGRIAAIEPASSNGGNPAEKLKYAKADAIVMHPGPINRGVEIDSEVADGERSVILNQVSYGIAVRMAVMSMAMSGQTTQAQNKRSEAEDRL